MIQLLARFGETIVVRPLPHHDHAKVAKLRTHQIAWWDEKHQKVQVSLAQDRKTQTLFRRDKISFLDPNGALSPKKTTLHMKFSDEVRFCFGVSLRDGEGIQLEPFECT